MYRQEVFCSEHAEVEHIVLKFSENLLVLFQTLVSGYFLKLFLWNKQVCSSCILTASLMKKKSMWIYVNNRTSPTLRIGHLRKTNKYNHKTGSTKKTSSKLSTVSHRPILHTWSESVLAQQLHSNSRYNTIKT